MRWFFPCQQALRSGAWSIWLDMRARSTSPPPASAPSFPRSLVADVQRGSPRAQAEALPPPQRPELTRQKLKKLLTGRVVLSPPDARGRVTFEAQLTLEPIVAELQLPFRPSPSGGSGTRSTPTARSRAPPACPTSSCTAPPPSRWRSRRRFDTIPAAPPRRCARWAVASAPWCTCRPASSCAAVGPGRRRKA